MADSDRSPPASACTGHSGSAAGAQTVDPTRTSNKLPTASVARRGRPGLSESSEEEGVGRATLPMVDTGSQRTRRHMEAGLGTARIVPGPRVSTRGGL